MLSSPAIESSFSISLRVGPVNLASPDNVPMSLIASLKSSTTVVSFDSFQSTLTVESTCRRS